MDIKLGKSPLPDLGLLVNRSILSLILVLVISASSIFYAWQVEREAEQSRLLAEMGKYERIVQTELQHLVDLIYRSSARAYSPDTPAIVNSFPWVREIGIVETAVAESKSNRHWLLTLSLAEVSRSLGGQVTFAMIDEGGVLLVLSRADETHTTRAIFSVAELTEFINDRVRVENLGITVEAVVRDPGIENTDVLTALHLGMPGLEFDVSVRDTNTATKKTGQVTSLTWLMIGALWVVWLLLFYERRRRLHQQSVVAQQKMRIENQAERGILAEVTSSIGHEINQPVAAIETLSDTAALMLEGGDYSGATKALEHIQSEALRVGQIVQAIRRLSKGETLAFETIDIVTTVKELVPLVKIICKVASFSLRIEAGETALPVNADRTAIEQIIINLIVNSHEAIAGAGAQSKKKSTIELSLAYADGYAIIRVQDNGPGIRQGLREEIFNSFMTTKTDGVGLGLNLSRSIAEKHLGWLRLMETGVQGSIFELRLPTNEPASMESK